MSGCWGSNGATLCVGVDADPVFWTWYSFVIGWVLVPDWIPTPILFYGGRVA